MNMGWLKGPCQGGPLGIQFHLNEFLIKKDTTLLLVEVRYFEQRPFKV